MPRQGDGSSDNGPFEGTDHNIAHGSGVCFPDSWNWAPTSHQVHQANSTLIRTRTSVTRSPAPTRQLPFPRLSMARDCRTPMPVADRAKVSPREITLARVVGDQAIKDGVYVITVWNFDRNVENVPTKYHNDICPSRVCSSYAKQAWNVLGLDQRAMDVAFGSMLSQKPRPNSSHY